MKDYKRDHGEDDLLIQYYENYMSKCSSEELVGEKAKYDALKAKIATPDPIDLQSEDP